MCEVRDYRVAASGLGPAALEAFEGPRLIHARQPDEPVHDRGQRRDLAELHAEQRRHEIEPRQADQPPVERADDEEHPRARPPVSCLSLLFQAPGKSGADFCI